MAADKLNIKIINNIIYYNDELLNLHVHRVGMVNSKTRLAVDVSQFLDEIKSSTPDVSFDFIESTPTEEDRKLVKVATNVINKKESLPFTNKEDWVWKTIMPGEAEESRGVFVAPVNAPDSDFLEMSYNQATEINVENNNTYYGQLFTTDEHRFFTGSQDAPYCVKALLVIWNSGHNVVFNAWVPGPVEFTQPS